MKIIAVCDTESQAMEFSLLLLVHDLLLPVIFVDTGMLVLDQIYMLNPTVNSERKVITSVHSLVTNVTSNP